MTFLDLKERLGVVLFGENKHKNSGNLKEITFLALCDIGMLTIPLSFLQNDTTSGVLRMSEEGDILGYPSRIEGDSSVVMIDAGLELALIYRIASLVVGVEKRAFFERQFYIEIDKFNFMRFKSLEGLCI